MIGLPKRNGSSSNHPFSGALAVSFREGTASNGSSIEEVAWWSVLSYGSMHLRDSLQCYIGSLAEKLWQDVTCEMPHVCDVFCGRL